MIAEEQRGHLIQFIHVPEAAVIRIVKEFYSMLKATEKIRSDCSVRFRGTWVSIDPDWINASYDGIGNCRLLSDRTWIPWKLLM